MAKFVCMGAAQMMEFLRSITITNGDLSVTMVGAQKKVLLRVDS